MRPPRGPSALRPAFDELVGAPDAFGLLFYAFFGLLIRSGPTSPRRSSAEPSTSPSTSAFRRARTRRSRSSAAAGAGAARRLQEAEFVAIEAQPWFDALGRAQLPRLLLAAGACCGTRRGSGSSRTDHQQHRSSPRACPAPWRWIPETDARAFGARRRGANFPRRRAPASGLGRVSALGGASRLYLPSAAGTVACAGPYAPSTFCEPRRGAERRARRAGSLSHTDGGRPGGAAAASQFPALVWCPAVARGVTGRRSRGGGARRRWAAAPAWLCNDVARPAAPSCDNGVRDAGRGARSSKPPWPGPAPGPARGPIGSGSRVFSASGASKAASLWSKNDGPYANRRPTRRRRACPSPIP